MLRISVAAVVAVMAMSFATSADAYISLNGPLAGPATDSSLPGAKDAGARAAAAKTVPLAVEAVILPTGETVDLR